ncbi:MAG: outer membrane beta-barrel protein [Candidatus Cyclobacteriaceae bacterium M3_2C_046]
MRIILFVLISIFYIHTSYAGNGSKESNFLSPKSTQQAARPNFPGDFMLEVGFTLLNSPPDLDLRLFGSRGANIYYLYHLPIGNSNFSFHPGLGLGMANYNFKDSVTLVTDDQGQTDFVNIFNYLENDQLNVIKSKLSVNYLDIPMELRFNLNKENPYRGFKMAVGGRIGILFDSHTKVKYEEDGDAKKLKRKEKYDLNSLRYSVYGRIGIGGFSVFYYQNLSSLFQKDEGPFDQEVNSFMAGVSIALF